MLVTQIKLGVYHFNDHLPYIKEMSLYLQVAPETIRYAYNKLKDNHYISLSKNTGAKIIIEYSQDEIQNHIQAVSYTHLDVYKRQLQHCLILYWGNNNLWHI